MPKTDKPTPKEAKYLAGVAAGKTKVQAAMDAYDVKSKVTASQMAAELSHKPRIQRELIKILERQGITLERAIAPIGQALTAEKTNEYTGEITPDIPTRLKGSDRALKLLGVKLDQNEGGTTNYNFINVVNKDREEFFNQEQ